MIFDYLKEIHFAQPRLLLLLLIIPVLIYRYYYHNRKIHSSLPLSVLAAPGLDSWKSSLVHLLFLCRLLCISCIIIALAWPQKLFDEQTAEGEGVDIVLCIDVSGSMTAQDFQPNRLEAAKKVAINFVNRRLTDRIAVVIFSGESFTQCPLTTDHNMLVSAIQNIRNGLLEDGTAIGSGLATSIDRLRNSTAKSKMVVLLTDGENNGGLIDPKTAKEIAKTFNVKVYTIGVGSDGFAPQPVNTPLGVIIQNEKVSIDEKLLNEIALETGGKYFRAKDNESLEGIYKIIDGMEKSKIEIINSVRHENRFLPFVLAAIFFLMVEWVMGFTVFRKFP